MLKLKGKKIFTILRLLFYLNLWRERGEEKERKKERRERERERERGGEKRERKHPAIQHCSFGNMTPSWGSLKYGYGLI